MPIYQFECEKCGDITELIASSNKIDNIKVKCNECNRKKKRIISASNFKINGYSYSNGYSKGDK